MRSGNRKPKQNIPIQVNRRGKQRVIEVRREANEEMMQGSFRERGFVRLRVMVQIGVGHGLYVGFQGATSFRDVRSIREAREFERALRKFVGEESQ